MQTRGSLPQPAADSREAAIIADVARRFGLAPGAIYERSRAGQIPYVRQTAMWALAQIGHAPSAISRLLGLDHKTILHGIARVEARPDWQEVARPALTLMGGGGQRQALAVWLNTRLPAELGLAERRAVQAYAYCSLLGWERLPAWRCTQGMLLVRRDGRVRAALEEALRRCELGAHVERIRWHGARLAGRSG